MNLRRKTVEQRAAKAAQKVVRKAAVQQQIEFDDLLISGRHPDFFVSIQHNGKGRSEGLVEARSHGAFNTDLTVIPGPHSPLEEEFLVRARFEPPNTIIVAPNEIFELDRVVIHQPSDRAGVISAIDKIAAGKTLKSYQFKDPCDQRRHTGRLLSTGHLRLTWSIESPTASHPRAPTSSNTVLIVSANDPGNQSKALHFEEEFRSIKTAVEVKGGTVAFAPAARAEDLVAETSQHEPTVIHFAGHGNRGEIFLRTEQRRTDVDGRSLASFLDGRGVELVVLSCCLSDEVADEILPYVRAVVGTTDEVDDKQAQIFSETFYKMLFTGNSVHDAFRDATDVLHLNREAGSFALKGDVDYVLPIFRIPLDKGHISRAKIC